MCARLFASVLLLFVATSVQADERYFDCPVPEGLAQALSDRWDLRNAMGQQSLKGGWYALEARESDLAWYIVPQPAKVVPQETPSLVGRLSWIATGDRVTNLVACGASLSASGWLVTVEVSGLGFASFDIRDVLSDLPIPKGPQPLSAGAQALPVHVVHLDIAGHRYGFVVTAVALAFAPYPPEDPLDIARGDVKTPPADALIPRLFGLPGQVFADIEAADARWHAVPVATAQDALDSTRPPDDPMQFGSVLASQPVDLSATPIYLGHKAFFEGGMPFTNARDPAGYIEGDQLVLQLSDGTPPTADLRAWQKTRSPVRLPWGEVILVPQTLDILTDDRAYRLVVDWLNLPAATSAGEPQKGHAAIEFDLFASAPLTPTP